MHHQNSYYQANKIGNETRVEIHSACLVFLATVNKENSNSTRDFAITVELDKIGFKQYNSLVSIPIKLSGNKCEYYAIVTTKDSKAAILVGTKLCSNMAILITFISLDEKTK